MIKSTYKCTLTLIVGNEELEVNVPNYETPYFVAMNKNGDIFIYDTIPAKSGYDYNPINSKHHTHIASVVEVNTMPYIDHCIEVNMFDTIIDFNEGIAK